MIDNPKISIYVSSLSMGGAEKVSIYLAEYFISQGLEVNIVTNLENEQEYILRKDIKRVLLCESVNKKSTINITRNLRKHLVEDNIDILLVMGTPLITYASLASKGSRTKIIVSERNSPENFSGKKITQYLTNKFMNNADGFIFQTKEAKEYYSWIKDMEAAIIPNPLFLNEIPNIFTGIRKKQIVSVGRLHPQKNHHMLIEAFSLISSKHLDYNLVIYGEGKERKKLELLIEKLGLQDRVRLAGSVPNVLEKIKDSSVFAFSSDYEGMPNALIEAMALGLPVVSTDCPSGGPNELIKHKVNGLLSPVKDKEKFSENLLLLIEDVELAKNIGLKATDIKVLLDVNKIAKQWYDYCLKIYFL